MPEPETRAVADNLVEALRFFGRARQDAEIRDLAGVTLIFCGLNYAAFNAALMTQPVESDAELTRLIQISAAQFESKRLRWTYWLCDGFLSPPLSRQAPHIFSRHGLRQLTRAPGMFTERLLAPERELPALQVRAVSDPTTRATFAQIMSIAFDIPHSVSSAVYASECGWTAGGFQGFIGYANGKAVTTAATMITGDVIGLYSVATLPQYRRLGFAEAIMREVIEQARAHGGIERTVLQSTPSGLSLYEQMGYRTVTNFDVYIAD